MKDPRRSSKQRASATAAAAGKRFEVQCAGELKIMQASAPRLVASFRHTQPLFRAVGGGKFVPVKGGEADFHGIAPGAFFFAVECKSSAGHTVERSEFTKGEADDLDATAAAGGLALAVLEFRFAIGGWRCFGVPWKCMPWKAAGVAGSAGGLSVHVNDLNGWELRRPLWLGPFLEYCPACAAYRLRGARSCCRRS